MPKPTASPRGQRVGVEDAARLGIEAGDLVRIESPRGSIEVPARVGHGRAGSVFVPFHYGAWQPDDQAASETDRQANELTLTAWDPVSKQPYFKTAACRVAKVTP